GRAGRAPSPGAASSASRGWAHLGRRRPSRVGRRRRRGWGGGRCPSRRVRCAAAPWCRWRTGWASTAFSCGVLSGVEGEVFAALVAVAAGHGGVEDMGVEAAVPDNLPVDLALLGGADVDVIADLELLAIHAATTSACGAR